MLGPNAPKIPLTKIDNMLGDLEQNLSEKLRMRFSLQIDESTDVSGVTDN